MRQNNAIQSLLKGIYPMYKILFVCHGNSKVSIFGVAF